MYDDTAKRVAQTTDLAPVSVWRDHATAARRDHIGFVAAAYAYAERPRHNNGEHTDYLRALHSAELAKAEAAGRYLHYCDTVVGDLLADRDYTGDVA